MKTTPPGKSLLDAVAGDLAALLARGLERIFGPGVRDRAFSFVSWADLAVMLCLLLSVLLVSRLVAALLRRKIRRAAIQQGAKGWHRHFLGALDKPICCLIWVYGAYFAVTPLLLRATSAENLAPIRAMLDKVLGLGMFAALLWLFSRLTRVLEARLTAWTDKTESKFDDLLAPLVGRSLRMIVPVLGIIFALPVIGLPPEYAGVIAKGTSILLIVTVAWVSSQAMHLGEQTVLAEYDIAAADNLKARTIYTQVHVLAKTIYVVIGIFAVASVLMLFDEVRRFGTSLLASAGVIGVIAGFAAQRTIANLFAGFQIAMTQPIRLDDVVIVEGEWGRIEEITLTYVVIHIWDDRRLIVPLSQFIEKPFQNWTRASAALLGSVFVWADYSLPLDEVRKAAQQIVESCPQWDRRFWNLQVTDTTERAMQIRVLATAADSSKSWDLRCAIREQLIAYIQKSHPQGLPQIRAQLNGASIGPPSKP